jgi:hypothetical protein
MLLQFRPEDDVASTPGCQPAGDVACSPHLFVRLVRGDPIAVHCGLHLFEGKANSNVPQGVERNIEVKVQQRHGCQITGMVVCCLSLFTLSILSACSFGFLPAMVDVPALSSLPEGVRFTVDGKLLDPDAYGELRINIDYMPGTPPTMSISTDYPGSRKPEEGYSTYISFDMRDGGDFPAEFNQQSLEPARFDFYHPGEVDDRTRPIVGRGSTKQIEGIPPGINRGIWGELGGRTTIFLLTVQGDRIRGIFEAPFEFPRFTGASGKTYIIRFDFNMPFKPETSASGRSFIASSALEHH